MAAMRAYWRLALLLCRMTGTDPSMLLHPLDFLGREHKVGLDFFPGMSLGIDHKLAVVSEILESMSDGYSVVNMREHAKAIGVAQVDEHVHVAARRLPTTCDRPEEHGHRDVGLGPQRTAQAREQRPVLLEVSTLRGGDAQPPFALARDVQQAGARRTAQRSISGPERPGELRQIGHVGVSDTTCWCVR